MWHLKRPPGICRDWAGGGGRGADSGGGGSFLLPEPAISVTNLFFDLKIGHAGHTRSYHVILA